MSTKPPSGTRDFLPDDIRRREYVIGVTRDVYERYGYEPLETPAFENIETLLGKYGEEGNKLIFKILKRGEHEATGEADLALRYDLTVPLARVVAQYQNELPKFFKRYQIQPVWRADRPAKGRFREFYQCDVDAIGSTSPVVEADILSAVAEVLTTLGFQDFRIRLNDRRLLTTILNVSGIRPEQHGDALIALDKLDKIGVEGVERDLVSRNIPQAVATTYLGLLHEAPDDPAARHLDEIVALCAKTPAAGRIQIDLSLARGLSYYTGAIMEIAVPDLAGSLGGGGRYDNLIGMFLGRDVPACGFSLGLERIIVVMTERNMFPEKVARGGVDILVTIWNAESRGDALALAGELRAGGLRVDVYPEADKLGKQFKYASSRNVPFVAVVGDDERARDEVAIKDMRSGEQIAVPRPDVGAAVSRRLR
jgi:histidyl-tRNA synthetase